MQPRLGEVSSFALEPLGEPCKCPSHMEAMRSQKTWLSGLQFARLFPLPKGNGTAENWGGDSRALMSVEMCIHGDLSTHALMGLCTVSLQPHNWSRWQNARLPATPGEKLPALWGSVLFLMHLFLRFPLKSCRPTRAKTLRQKTVRIVTSASFLTEWIRAPTMTFSPAGRRQRCSRVAEVPPAHRCTPWLSPSPTTRRGDALTRSRPS